jgi:hypothetical protein
MRKYLLLIIYTENKPSTVYTTKTEKKNAMEYNQNLLTHLIRNEMCLCKTKVSESRFGKSYFT